MHKAVFDVCIEKIVHVDQVFGSPFIAKDPVRQIKGS